MYSSFGNPKLVGTFFDNDIHTQSYAHIIHKHSSQLELLYVSAGHGRYQVGHREYAVSEGDLLICNNETLHGQPPMQKIFLQTHCIALTDVQLAGLPANQLIASSQPPLVTFEGTNRRTMHFMMHTIHEKYHEETPDLPLCHSLAMSILLLTWNALQARQDSDSFRNEQKKEMLVRQIGDYLDRNYREPINLQQISDDLHLSVSHISHLYKNKTGLSPMQFVLYRRLGEAQTLLAETDLPIGEIEEELGFGSSSHLSIMFKKYIGISPSEYRKRFR